MFKIWGNNVVNGNNNSLIYSSIRSYDSRIHKHWNGGWK